MSDKVVHPPHYNKGKIEVWDFIVDQNLDFFDGNFIKYVCRAGFKEGVDALSDLKKAREYLEKKIQMLEAETGAQS